MKKKQKKYIINALKEFLQNRESNGKIILLDDDKSFKKFAAIIRTTELSDSLMQYIITPDDLEHGINRYINNNAKPLYFSNYFFLCYDFSSFNIQSSENKKDKLCTMLLFYINNFILPLILLNPDLTIIIILSNKLIKETHDAALFYNSWETGDSLFDITTLPRISTTRFDFLFNRFLNYTETHYQDKNSLIVLTQRLETPERSLIDIFIEFFGYGRQQIDIINAEKEKIERFRQVIKVNDEQLDDNQIASICSCPRGTSFVVATAGSGKTTKVIYNRIKLVDELSDNKTFSLFITFNRSIKEQAHRDILNKLRVDNCQVHTYHSFARDYLKYSGNSHLKKSIHPEGISYADKITIINEFKKKIKNKGEYFNILNNVELEDFIEKEALEKYEKSVIISKLNSLSGNDEMKIAIELFDFFIRQEKLIFFHDLYNSDDLDKWKNQIINQKISNNDNRRYYNSLYLLIKIYLKGYAQNAFNFDDMIYLFLKDCRENRTRVKKYLSKYDHFFIDEFQDADISNLMIIEHLLTFIPNATLVGDDDQIIYEWRGSSIDFFQNFSKMHPDTNVTYLPINYRCPYDITEISKVLISKNQKRFKKEIISNSKKISEVQLLQFARHGKDQFNINANVIALIRDNYINSRETAILCRNKSMVDSYCNEFRRLNILYDKMESGVGYSDNTHIVSLVSIGTIHAVKGRTFRNVILITKGIYYKDRTNIQSIEEQRRVVYVAYTRASEKLYVSLDINQNYRTKEFYYSASEILRESGISLQAMISPQSIVSPEPFGESRELKWIKNFDSGISEKGFLVNEQIPFDYIKIYNYYNNELGKEFELLKKIIEFDNEIIGDNLKVRYPYLPEQVLHYLKICEMHSETSEVIYEFSKVTAEGRLYHHIVLLCGLALELSLNIVLFPCLKHDYPELIINRGNKKIPLSGINMTISDNCYEGLLSIGAYNYIFNQIQSAETNDNNTYADFTMPDFLETFNRLRELRNTSAHPDNASTLYEESFEIRKIVYQGDNTTFDIINKFASLHSGIDGMNVASDVLR